MSVTTPRRPLARRSTLLFDWRAEDVSLVARTGQVLNFARNSAADLVTTGATISVPAHVPRFSMVGGTTDARDTPVLRIDEADSPRVAEVVSVLMGFAPPDALTIYARHCPSWYDDVDGITTDAYLWQWGAEAPFLSCYRAGDAGTYVAEIVTGDTDASQSAPAPVTRTQEVLVQYAGLLSGGTVRIDTGSGLSAASPAASAVETLGSLTLFLGCAASTGNEARSGLVALKIASGLHSLETMRTRA